MTLNCGASSAALLSVHPVAVTKSSQPPQTALRREREHRQAKAAAGAGAPSACARSCCPALAAGGEGEECSPALPTARRVLLACFFCQRINSSILHVALEVVFHPCQSLSQWEVSFSFGQEIFCFDTGDGLRLAVAHLHVFYLFEQFRVVRFA